MSKYLSSPRLVDALRIERVEPLENNGVITLAGIKLVLEDRSTVRWVMPNPLEFTPNPGDFLVHDRIVAVDYIVASTEFQKLFQHVITA
jgi:hypothetical protein